MAQTREGALKIAAKHAGMTLTAYKRRSKTEKRCTKCRTWRDRATAFCRDRARVDGLNTTCRDCASQRSKATYKPRPRPQPGRRYVAARDGDQKQARGRVNYLVRAGLIPDPDDLSCTDCGHKGKDKRHEYDHHLGYIAEHHENVEAVCTTCHHDRAAQRGESWHLRAERDALGRFKDDGEQ